MEFGDRVRERRPRLGLSQRALAFGASINRTYIASLGRRNPSLDLVAGLDVDLSVLVRGLQAKLLAGRGSYGRFVLAACPGARAGSRYGNIYRTQATFLAR